MQGCLDQHHGKNMEEIKQRDRSNPASFAVLQKSFIALEIENFAVAAVGQPEFLFLSCLLH